MIQDAIHIAREVVCFVLVTEGDRITVYGNIAAELVEE
jgi:hypothetical protein